MQLRESGVTGRGPGHGWEAVRLRGWVGPGPGGETARPQRGGQRAKLEIPRAAPARGDGPAKSGRRH